ncbi:hypothetical protein VaNZ11_011703 [Volvox africanus]|uniref:Uncharacterized protein n=1 Tax=Volvox africanus TaxID=51714 RepID=A0ABQ5SC97_9CHLO|nr:hypothetical protein VaNZ11_011703 [Volvox africanus]
MAQQLEVDSPFHADARSLLGIIVAVLIGAVATAAGVGGGAIYIPLFNVLVGFALKPSTALSQACIAAGSLAAVATNLPRTHPSVAAAPLIDFPLVLLLTPLLLVGVGIGVLLNVTLPSWLLNILLLVLLLLLLAQAVAKGKALWVQETKRAQAAAEAMAHRDIDIENSAESPDRTAASGSGMLEALLPAGHRRSFSHPALAAVTCTEPPGLDLRRGHSYSGPRAPVALEADQDVSSGRLAGLENSGMAASHQPSIGGSAGIAGGSSSIRPARRFATVSWDCTENTTGDGTARCETPYSSVSMPPSTLPFAGPIAPSFVGADDVSAEGPTRSIPGGAASSRALSTASSAIYAASWKAFNELGALEFETDLEGDSDFEGAAPVSSVVGRHMRSTRASGFGSGTASPALLPPSSYILSQLPRRLLLAQTQLSSATRSPHNALGRRTTRRRSFDQATGADLPAAASAAMDEEAGLAGNSWLQRRSKWRSRFPPGALPHRGAARAALLPAHAYPGSSSLLPPVQQLPPSPGTALRASGSGVMRLQSRSQRQCDGVVGDAEGGRGGLDEPLLGLQGEVPDRPHGAIPDPRAEYGGGGAAAAGTATAAGGDRVLAVDSYRPPTRLATLHEESDDRAEGGTSGGGSGSQSTQAVSRLPHQLPSMAASTSTASLDQLPALPTSQPAADWDPLRRPSLQPLHATSASLYDRHVGNHGTGGDGTTDAMALRWTAMGTIGYVYIECMSDTEAEKRHLGRGWCCQANFICGAIAAAVRQWADEWAAALSRIPHRFACGLVGAWVVYLVLQGARDFKTQCSPAWWALFAIQIVAMLAISGGAMVMATTALSKHAEAAETSNGGVRVEGREGAPGGGEDRSGSIRRRQQQQQHGHVEEKESHRGGRGLSAAVAVEPALQCTAAMLVLQAPLTTLCATFGAGLTGGLLGLGGGMVMGPLLLQIGVQPQVTAASSGAMVLFSSSAALIQFALLHRLNGAYAGVFAAASLVAGVAGTHAVARAIKRSGRPSIVVLALAGVMGIGTVCVAAFGLHQAANQLRTGELGFAGICNSCGGQ